MNEKRYKSNKLKCFFTFSSQNQQKIKKQNSFITFLLHILIYNFGYNNEELEIEDEKDTPSFEDDPIPDLEKLGELKSLNVNTEDELKRVMKKK